MTRAFILHGRVLALHILGDGPWLWAAQGRLMAETHMEPPGLPWYANPDDQTPVTVAYWREKGRAGFYNRHWRKRSYYARRVLEVLRGE